MISTSRRKASIAQGIQPNVSTIAAYLQKKMAKTGVKLLWGTANMFSNRRFMAGAATNPDPDVFAYCAAQVKHCLDVTQATWAARTTSCGAGARAMRRCSTPI